MKPAHKHTNTLDNSSYNYTFWTYLHRYFVGKWTATTTIIRNHM